MKLFLSVGYSKYRKLLPWSFIFSFQNWRHNLVFVQQIEYYFSQRFKRLQTIYLSGAKLVKLCDSNIVIMQRLERPLCCNFFVTSRWSLEVSHWWLEIWTPNKNKISHLIAQEVNQDISEHQGFILSDKLPTRLCSVQPWWPVARNSGLVFPTLVQRQMTLVWGV